MHGILNNATWRKIYELGRMWHDLWMCYAQRMSTWQRRHMRFFFNVENWRLKCNQRLPFWADLMEFIMCITNIDVSNLRGGDINKTTQLYQRSCRQGPQIGLTRAWHSLTSASRHSRERNFVMQNLIYTRTQCRHTDATKCEKISCNTQIVY